MKKICKDHLEAFYKELDIEKQNIRPKLDGSKFKTINQEKAEKMEMDFRETEVRLALDSLAADKSPGPEGFPVEVYKRCWHFQEGRNYGNNAGITK